MDLPPTVVDNSERSRRDILADRVELEALPQSLYLDVSNRCNISCPMCPNHRVGGDVAATAIMAPDLFYRMGRELFPSARTVYLFGGGEVFLHPQWDELFDFARRWSFLPIISTNGSCSTNGEFERWSRLEPICESRSTAPTARPLSESARGLASNAWLGGIQRLVREREVCPGTRFSIRFSVTAFEANIRQAPRIVELASDLGVDRVVFHHLMVDRNEMCGSELRLFPELSDECLALAMERGADLGVHVQVPPPFDDRSAAADRIREAARRIPADPVASFFDYPLGPDATFLCRVPWVETWIKPNGEVAPCCLLAMDYRLGDVSGSSFREVWNVPKYQRLRRHVNSLQLPPPCSPAACALRRHQAQRGLLGAEPFAFERIVLDSRCPGHLRADLRELETTIDGRRLRVRFAVSNAGDTLWLAERDGHQQLGVVRLGAQAMSPSGELRDKDFFRVPLPENLPPGGTAELTFDAELPDGVDCLRFDLVAEGVSWFEDQGGNSKLIGVDFGARNATPGRHSRSAGRSGRHHAVDAVPARDTPHEGRRQLAGSRREPR